MATKTKHTLLKEFLKTIEIPEEQHILIVDFVKETYKKKENNWIFIDSILTLFCDKYCYHKGIEYDVVNKGKERLAIGQILALYKKKYTDNDSDKTYDDMGSFFDGCLTITDTYISNNISLYYIANNLNKIKLYINNGANKKNSRASQEFDSFLDAAFEKYGISNNYK